MSWRPLLGCTLAAAMATLLGCSTQHQAAAPPVPAGAPTPRVVTDLSTLSSASSSPASLLKEPSSATAASRESGSAATAPADELRRLFLEKPGAGRFAGTAARPGDERLLNAKAAQFPEFSSSLLNQVFVAAQNLEGGQFARHVLSEKLKSTVITAIMDRDGKLKELILEQHSGSGAVDQLMLKACKQGLWARNPPPEALTPDGDYRFRIEGRLKNWSSTDQIHWNFETHVGLALL